MLVPNPWAICSLRWLGFFFRYATIDLLRLSSSSGLRFCHFARGVAFPGALLGFGPGFRFGGIKGSGCPPPPARLASCS